MVRSRYRKNPSPPKKRVANTVLAFAFIFLTLFTVVMMVAFFITGNEPSTLISCVYAFWGAEVIGLLIKRIFDKQKNSKNDEETGGGG